MTLDKHVIENIKSAVSFLTHEDRLSETVYIHLRSGDERYIDWMVTRSAGGTWYYGDTWIYWDGSIYSFKFDPKAFLPEPTIISNEEKS